MSFQSFTEFYPYYLAEHRDARCRRCHFVGSFLVILLVFAGVVVNPWWFAATPVVGYGFAWIGHFVFEKNRPATFKHPLYSLMGDWVMFKDMIMGRVSWT
ncbi:MAG: DUF962 domain-containing protein [Acidobacteria bacterium]|nr:DUF962 domain-containing protein [Acidobacteriota bacterium]